MNISFASYLVVRQTVCKLNLLETRRVFKQNTFVKSDHCKQERQVERKFDFTKNSFHKTQNKNQKMSSKIVCLILLALCVCSFIDVTFGVGDEGRINLLS